MSLSLRGWAELIGGLALTGLLIWQVLTAAGLRTELANQKVATRTQQLLTQAADASQKSCQAALGQVQVATGALVTATQRAYASAEIVAQRASGRDQEVAQAVSKLLAVRPAAGQDCQTATGLARSAWEEGQ